MKNPAEYTLKEINGILLDLELEYELFDEQADGTYYWERVRHPVHKSILKKIEQDEVKSQPERQKESSFKQQRELVSKAVVNIIEKNPFFSERSDIIFYAKGRRRQLDDGTWYDMYLDPIAETVDDQYTFIEPKGGPPDAASENRRFLTFPRFLGDLAWKVGYRYNLPERNVTTLHNFEQAIENELGVSVDVVGEVERVLSKRRIRLPLFKQVVRRIDPDICFMTYGHSRHSTFIEACHSHDVTVIDVQHCAFHKNYWPYHYPGERERRIKPDHLFIWGEYWKEAVELPFDDTSVHTTGFPYYERQQKKYTDTATKEQLLFISNRKSGPELSKLAADLADENIDLDIVYKLHGGEFDIWREEYPKLAAAADADKLIVLDEMEGSLHRLLAESRAQVGITSTAIYEGIGFGVPTFVFDVPRAYEIEALTQYEYVNLVSSADELATHVHSLDNIPVPDVDAFFKRSSLQNMSDIITELRH